jgi:hypothetical protein
VDGGVMDKRRVFKFTPSAKVVVTLNDHIWCRYRKKPVIIEAFRTDQELIIETLEGNMVAKPGDFIIRGVRGELYPCKPDIFNDTYEKV